MRFWQFVCVSVFMPVSPACWWCMTAYFHWPSWVCCVTSTRYWWRRIKMPSESQMRFGCIKDLCPETRSNINQYCHTDLCMFFFCPLSLDRLCLNGLVPRCLQGQHNQVAIGRAEGVQLLHLIAYFIDLWPWWLAAYQCRVITIGHCEVE